MADNFPHPLLFHVHHPRSFLTGRWGWVGTCYKLTGGNLSPVPDRHMQGEAMQSSACDYCLLRQSTVFTS